MTKYEQLKEESQQLNSKLISLATWLHNTKAGATEYCGHGKHGIVSNDHPQPFEPFLSIGNRDRASFGWLTLDVGEDLTEVLEAIIPALENIHRKTLERKQRIDSTIAAVEELLKEDDHD